MRRRDLEDGGGDLDDAQRMQVSERWAIPVSGISGRGPLPEAG